MESGGNRPLCEPLTQSTALASVTVIRTRLKPASITLWAALAPSIGRPFQQIGHQRGNGQIAVLMHRYQLSDCSLSRENH